MLVAITSAMCVLVVAAIVAVLILANPAAAAAQGEEERGGGGGGGEPGGSPGQGVSFPRSKAAGFLMDLPVADLRKPNGGAWNTFFVSWKRSGLASLQGVDAIKVFYSKGVPGAGAPNSGALIGGKPRVLPRTSLVVAFDVYYDPGFGFGRGAKMVGITVGQGKASGGLHTPTSASHRVNWQDGGAAISYIYPPKDVPQTDPRLKDYGYGSQFFRDVFKSGTLKIGQWNHVEVGVKVNTFTSDGAPNPDGVAYLHINGKSATLDGVRWSRSPDLRITEVHLGTFYGGGAPVDCTAYYANFRLYNWIA